jgi:phenylalanyl-tRNA synthetase alpha chain
MRNRLEEMLSAGRTAMEGATAEAELQEVKVRFLGKKGELTAIMKGMGALSTEERPQVGALANRVKDDLENLFASRLALLRQAEIKRRLEQERIDVSLPGRVRPTGSKHPITLVTEEICGIFSALGFGVAEGPRLLFPQFLCTG